MKTAFVLVSVVVLVALVQGKSSPGFKIQVRPLAVECQKAHPVSKDELEAIVDLQTNVSHDGKCVMSCVQEKIGFLKNGEFQEYDKTIGLYKKLVEDDEVKTKNAEKVFKGCLDKAKAAKASGEGLCEAAYIGTKCIAES